MACVLHNQAQLEVTGEVDGELHLSSGADIDNVLESGYLAMVLIVTRTCSPLRVMTRDKLENAHLWIPTKGAILGAIRKHRGGDAC